MINGYDVSQYQPVQFPVAGIDFAIIKITEGTGIVNPVWVQQRQWAHDHGLSVGFYHFARGGSMTAQADYFLSKVNLQAGEHLWFDWEDEAVGSAQKDAWIRYVQSKEPAHRVGLYCNGNFWKNIDRSGFAGDGLWFATSGFPAGHPPITAPWLIHQYSTANNIDHDVAQFNSRAEMVAWALGGVPPVPEEDMPLNDADKAWIKAAVTDALKANVYAESINKDSVRSPNDDPANPYWSTASYLRETYRRIQDVKKALDALDAKISALPVGGVTPGGVTLDELKATLASIKINLGV